MKYIIKYEPLNLINVFEDYAFIGPFESQQEALKVGRLKLERYQWCVYELTAYDPDNLPLLKADFQRMKLKENNDGS